MRGNDRRILNDNLGERFYRFLYDAYVNILTLTRAPRISACRHRNRAPRGRPAPKPVALVGRAVRNSSKSRDTVLDPFGGSGTTLVARGKTGRQVRLVEMGPKYVDVIVKR